jgi:hypothetical protein
MNNMCIIECLDNEGKRVFSVGDMYEDDLRSLLNIIDSAYLPERRHWNGIRGEVYSILKDMQTGGK